MVAVTVELVELHCRCQARMTRVQYGAAYYNTCPKCGHITVGIAGQRPSIAPLRPPTPTAVSGSNVLARTPSPDPPDHTDVSR